MWLSRNGSFSYIKVVCISLIARLTCFQNHTIPYILPIKIRGNSKKTDNDIVHVLINWIDFRLQVGKLFVDVMVQPPFLIIHADDTGVERRRSGANSVPGC